MDITDVRVRKIAADGKLRGIASITFEDVYKRQSLLLNKKYKARLALMNIL